MTGQYDIRQNGTDKMVPKMDKMDKMKKKRTKKHPKDQQRDENKCKKSEETDRNEFSHLSFLHNRFFSFRFPTLHFSFGCFLPLVLFVIVGSCLPFCLFALFFVWKHNSSPEVVNHDKTFGA